MNPLMMLAAAGPGQTFIVQCLGFAVLVFVIVKLALPPLGKILAARTTSGDSRRSLGSSMKKSDGAVYLMRARARWKRE